MTDYRVIRDLLVIYFTDRDPIKLFLNDSSGQIYYRYKIDAVFNSIPHPAIYIGNDSEGKHYFIHNHINAGTAVLVTEQEFTQGQPYFYDNRSCTNSLDQVLYSALNQATSKEPYHFKVYNCQTLTNIACTNTRKSETVEKILSNIAIVAFAFFAGKALLSSSK